LRTKKAKSKILFKMSGHNHENEQDSIPELRLIRAVVQSCLPEGHRLRGVDLTVGSLDGSDEPRFMVLVELEHELHAPEPYGWAERMAKMIRQKWPKDEFDVKVTIVMA
jgi:hypothetical protein